MIITDRFTFVHVPKTGGTFVSSVLFRLYHVRWTWVTHLISSMKRNLVYKRDYGTFIYNNNKHGTCAEIPPEHLHKPVLMVIRNPYDLYVSQYEFGWWKRKEFLPYYRTVDGFPRDYTRFPDLSFEEYVKLVNAAFCSPRDGARDEGPALGLQSELLVKYAFRNPQAVLQSVNEERVASGHYREDMYDVRFIRTHRLNQGLYDFLLGMGYEREDLEFILSLGKILPGGRGRAEIQRWEKYYTPELKDKVRKKEWLFFSLFPEFDN
jgi:hypothetical protein